MKTDFVTLLRSKTFYLSIAAAMTAVGAYVAGEATLQTTLVIIFQATAAVFLRDAIAKS